MKPFVRCFLLCCSLWWCAPALAEIWGYVDDEGIAHFATEKVDERYQLFAKTGEVFDTGSLQPAAETPAKPLGNGRMTRALDRLLNSPRLAQYEALIEAAAREHAVEPALIKAVIAVESGFRPQAISPKGALGLMQVIPATGSRYGVAGDRRSIRQQLLDPSINIRTGVRYLGDLLKRFANDGALALAAYNAGEGAVQRYRNKVPPFPETQAYVKLVQQLSVLFQSNVPATPSRIRMVIPAQVAQDT